MKTTNFAFDSIESLQRHNFKKYDPKTTLIQVFSGFIKEDEIEQIKNILNEKGLKFIGTTTAGEIYEGKSIEKSIVVSITEFEKSSVKNVYFEGSEEEIGKNLSLKFTPNSKLCILFINGLELKGENVLINIKKDNVLITGGAAGDYGNIERTFIFNENKIIKKGLIAAIIDSNDLHIINDYELNWEPFGKLMEVTKAKDNVLYEIDGINAKEIYRKYLGPNVADALPYSATEFPLIKIDGEDYICRTVANVNEDGSLGLIGNLYDGDKVKFAVGNLEMIISKTDEDIKNAVKFDPQAIFIYSCAARKSFLGEQVSFELKPFADMAPTCGFFTYGEILDKKENSYILNNTLTFIALSEDYQPLKTKTYTEKKAIKNMLKDKCMFIIDAMIHLSNEYIKELETTNQKLLQAAITDPLTGAYNRRYFYEISQKFISFAQREFLDEYLIMLDIDNFKKINDTYGHDIGDEVIKHLVNTVKSSIRSSDVLARFGGEEFVIFLNNISRENALKIAEKIRKNIQNSSVEGVKYTISLGVAKVTGDIETTIKHADLALYEAKNSGKNRVVEYKD